MRSLLTLAMMGQVADNVAAAAAVFVPSSVTADYQLQLQLGSSRCQHKLPRFTYLLTYLLTYFHSLITAKANCTQVYWLNIF